MRPLATVPPGTRCRVVSVRGTDVITQRLMEMGIISGADLEVVRVAPLGDPIQISVMGYRLAIRKSEAARVDVLP